ncbi:hypothetical protein ACFOKI_08380 [Sphingomonas qilianensis]|uniref:Uncharacterized protein n=1 Tax=Sphingomonas qilianensis TaxID=1736690 RepID=A0ABU9XT05_9SPHN
MPKLKPKNERDTENLVRDRYRNLGYNQPGSGVVVTEQATLIEAARKALSAASKAGGGGKGAPEFIVSDPSTPDFIMVVECKASVADHASTTAAIDLLSGPPGKCQTSIEEECRASPWMVRYITQSTFQKRLM